MELQFHGGLCCGIKVISGFYTPDFICQQEERKDDRNLDQYGNHVSSAQGFFTGAAPKETQLERLDRLINWCEKRRPEGIIEIVLVDGSWWGGNQLATWGPLIRRRGFRCVNKSVNSNSGNTIHVFHRNSGKAKPIKLKEEK